MEAPAGPFTDQSEVSLQTIVSFGDLSFREPINRSNPLNRTSISENHRQRVRTAKLAHLPNSRSITGVFSGRMPAMYERNRTSAHEAVRLLDLEHPVAL